mmetsp:Transcript_19163/g.60275  ORF Transcript_19163/g.60275 Transcript_19163/m.60275 type:complete len:433 (-) Transcript_19163:465-1763(-)
MRRDVAALAGGHPHGLALGAKRGGGPRPPLAASGPAAFGARRRCRRHHAWDRDVPPLLRAAHGEVLEGHPRRRPDVLDGPGVRDGARVHRPAHAPALRPHVEVAEDAQVRPRLGEGPGHRGPGRRRDDGLRLHVLHPRGQRERAGVAAQHLEPGAGHPRARHRHRPHGGGGVQRHPAPLEGGPPPHRSLRRAHGVDGLRHQTQREVGRAEHLRPLAHRAEVQHGGGDLVGRLALPQRLRGPGRAPEAGLPPRRRHGLHSAALPRAVAARPRHGHPLPPAPRELPGAHCADAEEGAPGQDALGRLVQGLFGAEPCLPADHRGCLAEGHGPRAAGHRVLAGAGVRDRPAVHPLREGHGGAGLLSPLPRCLWVGRALLRAGELARAPAHRGSAGGCRQRGAARQEPVPPLSGPRIPQEFVGRSDPAAQELAVLCL